MSTRQVILSAAQARQRFHGCTPEYIANVCHAACCRSTVAPTGIVVSVLPDEQPALEARGAVVKDGLVQPRAGEKRCPFTAPGYLCGLHGSSDKPTGCIASPFTLNPAGTRIIVRNRYRLLRCYRDDRDGPAPPAYEAFRASLDLILGASEAARAVEHLVQGGDDLLVRMDDVMWLRLRGLDAVKPGRATPTDQMELTP